MKQRRLIPHVVLALALGSLAVPSAQRKQPSPPAPPPGKANWLTDGDDTAAHVVAAQRDAAQPGDA